MNPRFPLLLTACLAVCFSVSGAVAQAAVAPDAPPLAGRYGVQLGGVPPFLVSAGGYARLSDTGSNRLEGRVLLSSAFLPTFASALGAEADLLISRPLSERWRVYGGLAAAVANISPGDQSTYFGLGGLVGVRSGPGLGIFAEAGVATFFGGVTGPLLRLGVNYSF
ncbi:hypothetical protein [Deinococcus rubellus]|uniref:Outer membrane protein beta-barrel domain-containing protein n=1 Tax=Deinococcus rubellus TaxID=1889240 RepID=A0ABY5YHS7_9DEIO|nr:hypothetical protein [Deinococcus rubellus]UWX63657.1 hypothetical protein N0D28_13110 [Deinococcus rubellus]